MECVQLKEELEELQRLCYKKQMKFTQQRNSSSRAVSSKSHPSSINRSSLTAPHSSSCASGSPIQNRASSVPDELVNCGSSAGVVVGDEWLDGEEAHAVWEWSLDGSDLMCCEPGFGSDEELDADSLCCVTSAPVVEGGSSDWIESSIPVNSASEGSVSSSTLSKTQPLSDRQPTRMSRRHREQADSNYQIAREQRQDLVPKTTARGACSFITDSLGTSVSSQKQPMRSIYKRPRQDHLSANG